MLLESDRQGSIMKNPRNFQSVVRECDRWTGTPCCEATSGVAPRQGLTGGNVRGISGDDRDRTGNLRVANAALSQLSYVPGDSMGS